METRKYSARGRGQALRLLMLLIIHDRWRWRWRWCPLHLQPPCPIHSFIFTLGLCRRNRRASPSPKASGKSRGMRNYFNPRKGTGRTQPPQIYTWPAMQCNYHTTGQNQLLIFYLSRTYSLLLILLTSAMLYVLICRKTTTSLFHYVTATAF